MLGNDILDKVTMIMDNLGVVLDEIYLDVMSFIKKKYNVVKLDLECNKVPKFQKKNSKHRIIG